jgi:hypothetical protein
MITLDQFDFKQHPNHPRAIEGFYKTDTHEFRAVAGPGFNSSPGGMEFKGSLTDIDQVESFEFVVGSKKTMTIVHQAGWQSEEDINKYLEELFNKRVI